MLWNTVYAVASKLSINCLLTHQRLKLFFVSGFREKFTNCSSWLPWSSNPLEFLRYIFSLLKYGIFSILVFFNSVPAFILRTNNVYFLQYIAKIHTVPLNSKPLEFLWYLVPFLKYKKFNFRIFNSAPYSVLKTFDLKEIFCTQSTLKC